jgi:hypothetical protein
MNSLRIIYKAKELSSRWAANFKGVKIRVKGE